MRVLVTGSRGWKHNHIIAAKLGECLTTARSLGTDLTVVHGAAKSGADAIAESWARWHGITPERHPAHWEGPCIPECQPGHRRPCTCVHCRGMAGPTSPPQNHPPGSRSVCPAAGFYRNEAMVKLGADIVLAFIADNSKGATHCAHFAEQQGLNVLYFRNTENALF
jgi:hypothetical protein